MDGFNGYDALHRDFLFQVDIVLVNTLPIGVLLIPCKSMVYKYWCSGCNSYCTLMVSRTPRPAFTHQGVIPICVPFPKCTVYM